VIAVRWYLRFGLSYRDVEELLAERGVEVDHVTVYRWVQRFTPLLAEAARPCRHAVGDRWLVDETYVGTGAVLVWGIFRFRLLDLAPIARSRIFQLRGIHVTGPAQVRELLPDSPSRGADPGLTCGLSTIDRRSGPVKWIPLETTYR